MIVFKPSGKKGVYVSLSFNDYYNPKKYYTACFSSNTDDRYVAVNIEQINENEWALYSNTISLNGKKKYKFVKNDDIFVFESFSEYTAWKLENKNYKKDMKETNNLKEAFEQFAKAYEVSPLVSSIISGIAEAAEEAASQLSQEMPTEKKETCGCGKKQCDCDTNAYTRFTLEYNNDKVTVEKGRECYINGEVVNEEAYNDVLSILYEDACMKHKINSIKDVLKSYKEDAKALEEKKQRDAKIDELKKSIAAAQAELEKLTSL